MTLKEILENIETDILNDSFSTNLNIDKFTLCKNIKKSISKFENIGGELSDGYHTFDELYHHRAILFSKIANSNKEISWKSKLHDDGTMYDGMFIVGIETPEGQATYHYDIDPYWDIFNVQELDRAPKWDGHTPTDAINRIKSIPDIETLEPIFNIPTKSEFYDLY